MGRGTGGHKRAAWMRDWWAEAVVHFLTCLEQHSADRGLERDWDEEEYGYTASNFPHAVGMYLGGRSPQYWVCGYANNQAL